MFLFIPVKTDAPIRRRPVVNQALMAINVIVFLATGPFMMSNGAMGDFSRSIQDWGILNPRSLELHQFFSYQFLHGGFWHIFGNMLFLWVFGNSVNSKMGNVAYLFFYLAAGVFAGIGFVVTSDNPCLGASGAIAGVTTAYLALYPHTQVTVWYWLWLYIGQMHIQALMLIVGKMILWDNILAPRMFGGGMDMVAYEAHIAGYLFGFGLCMLLLWLKALPRDQFDILALVKRYNQRRQFRAAMADPNVRAQATYGRVAQPVFAGRPVAVPVADEKTIRLRKEIADALSRGDYATAVETYESLMAHDGEQVLSRRNMLDIANQLKTMGRFPQAVRAYEKFLKIYPNDAEAPNVRVMLGVLYTKYLEQHERAETLFRECREQFTDPKMRAYTDEWLASVLSALGKPPADLGDAAV